MDEADAAARPSARAAEEHVSPIGARELFAIFFRAGLEFGSGIGVTAYLMREFIDRRHAISRSEFMALYGLARIVPSGTVTALAVGFGHRYRGLPGTVIAVVAMIIPAFTLTVGLTVPYTLLAGSRALEVVNATLVPAAMAVLAMGAIRLSQEFFRPSIEIAIAAGTCAVVLLLNVEPALMLVVGGIVGAFAVRTKAT